MINSLIKEGKLVSFKQGDRISRSGEFPEKIYYIQNFNTVSLD